jgi:hypothetical protein
MRENNGIDIDSEPAAHGVARFRRLRRRLADAGEVPGHPVVQRVTLIGELDRAAGAVDQSGAEPGLELGD